MRRISQPRVCLIRGVGLVLLMTLVSAVGKPAPRHGLAHALGPSTASYLYSYLYPSFGFGPYSSFFSPFPSYPIVASPYPYLPNYWWVSPYPADATYQPGYNASAGYEWDSVETLLLSTVPPRARVTLDGVFVGTANYLGPIQLPLGVHTLRVEAAGHEACETTLKAERPSVRQLEIRLKPAGEMAQSDPAF